MPLGADGRGGEFPEFRPRDAVCDALAEGKGVDGVLPVGHNEYRHPDDVQLIQAPAGTIQGDPLQAYGPFHGLRIVELTGQ